MQWKMYKGSLLYAHLFRDFNCICRWYHAHRGRAVILSTAKLWHIRKIWSHNRVQSFNSHTRSQTIWISIIFIFECIFIFLLYTWWTDDWFSTKTFDLHSVCFKCSFRQSTSFVIFRRDIIKFSKVCFWWWTTNVTRFFQQIICCMNMPQLLYFSSL